MRRPTVRSRSSRSRRRAWSTTAAAAPRSTRPSTRTWSEFWADLVGAYREEVRRLGELGCTYLQFDDTSLAYLNDPEQREHVREIGGDAEHQHETYIRHINEALADRPEGMAVTTHMCRGNFRSSWVAEGGYDFVAEALFNELDVDGFFMEWDDARSGGFEPLRFVPQGQGRRARPRHHQARRARGPRRCCCAGIEEASQFVDVDQLCLSPQCGFSSTVEGNELTREQQADKLRLVVDVGERGLGLEVRGRPAGRRSSRPGSSRRPRSA